MVHSLATIYTRWSLPPSSLTDKDIDSLENNLAINVIKDLDWLEMELQSQSSTTTTSSNESANQYLAGGTDFTAADTMCLFSILFIFARGLYGAKAGQEEEKWPAVKGWMARCEGTESWRRAVERTGHVL